MRAMTMGTLLALVAFSGLSGCRGQRSPEPPVHLNPNMDSQDRYKAYRHGDFFADGRAMRTPVAGTVARGYPEDGDHWLKEDDAYWRGCADDRDCDQDGEYVKHSPVAPTRELMNRGQQRFNIYCAPCHDQAGYGSGPVVNVKSPTGGGWFNVPSFHQDYIRNYPDGHLFSVIMHGSRSKLMKGYAHQIPVEDRWAIVAYVRALQRSQHAGSKQGGQ